MSSLPGCPSSAVNVRPSNGGTSHKPKNSGVTHTPGTDWGNSSPRNVSPSLSLYAARRANKLVCWRASRSASGLMPGHQPRSLCTTPSCTNRSGCSTGSGSNTAVFTTLTMAVVAPMPSARVSTATAVKPGFFSNWRKANFKSVMVRGQRDKSQIPNPKRQRNPKHQVPNHAPEAPGWRLRFGAYLGFGFWDLEFSFVSQRLHRIDLGRSAGRHVAGHQRNRDEQRDHAREGRGVGRR